MKKLLLCLIVMPTICFFAACGENGNDQRATYARHYLDGTKIYIETDTDTTYKYWLKVESLVIDSGLVVGNKQFDLAKIIKNNSINRKEIALYAAKNNFTHKIRLQIGDFVDTIYTYRQTVTNIPDDSISFTGFGAPLVRKAKHENAENELRIWLYRKQEHLSDSLFDAFKSIYSELSLSSYNEYIPIGTIPVVHDIDAFKYKINCNIQADYYAVVACKTQAYINNFIEQAVGNNFEGISTSLSLPLSCSYKKGSSGYRNVFLLCINKDWSYKQIPIATFALDNSAPTVSLYDASIRYMYRQSRNSYSESINSSDKEPTSLNYDDKIRIVYPTTKPQIFGAASVTVTDWAGSLLECNVTFHVEFSGDVKSATIQRRGNLCDYDSYFGYRLKPEDKVIYAKDHKGSYTFTYKMHFENGNNTIPVIVEDYHGNQQKGSITVNAKFVRTDVPSINIDNNIDIYNN